MSKPKIYIAERVPGEVLSYLERYCHCEMWEGEGRAPKDAILSSIHDKEGAILTGVKIDEDFLNKAPKLKVVSNISVGYNNFHIDAMKERNVIGTHTPYVLDDTVADLILGLILSAARRIPELDRYVKSGMWSKGDDREFFGVDCHHSTLGIIGMGRIGEAVAKRAKGFDMEILYYNRMRKPEAEEKLGAKYTDMKPLLKDSDFIVLMTPLTKETYHLIDFEEFSLMKRTAVFINASRGKTINEHALIDALENKKILAAGLDVYETEPIDTHNPLLKMDNVITLPHIGSSTEKTRLKMDMTAAENLVKALLNEEVPNVVPELR